MNQFRITAIHKHTPPKEAGKWAWLTVDLVDGNGRHHQKQKCGIPGKITNYYPTPGDLIFASGSSRDSMDYVIDGAVNVSNQHFGNTSGQSDYQGGRQNGYSGGNRGGYKKPYKGEGSGSAKNKEGYWEKKTKFEEEVLNPQLRFTSYLQYLTPFYMEYAKQNNMFASTDEMYKLINMLNGHALKMAKDYHNVGNSVVSTGQSNTPGVSYSKPAPVNQFPQQPPQGNQFAPPAPVAPPVSVPPQPVAPPSANGQNTYIPGHAQPGNGFSGPNTGFPTAPPVGYTQTDDDVPF